MDWMMVLKAFVVGGLICIIGQILIDKTKLTPARILVAFVTTGVILGGLRNLSKINRLCRMRCNSSTNWIWKPTCKRRNFRSKRKWFCRSIYRRYKSFSSWNIKCNFFWIHRITHIKTKNQKTIKACLKG